MSTTADKMQYENTAHGAVQRHVGSWRSHDGDWCALVPLASDPQPGHFVRLVNRSGKVSLMLLNEVMERSTTHALFSVREYDGRYDDFDPDDFGDWG